MPPLDDWEPFELREVPLSEQDEQHSRTCFACERKWTLSAFAVHEATHAAVALDLGLRPLFVAIDAEQEIEVTKTEASLYPLIKAGMKIPAVCTRLDDRDITRSPKKVLTAMAAPSCVRTGHRVVDEYAAVESCIAVERARALDLDPDEILDWAQRTVSRPPVQDHILALAARLAQTGWVDLAE